MTWERVVFTGIGAAIVVVVMVIVTAVDAYKKARKVQPTAEAAREAACESEREVFHLLNVIEAMRNSSKAGRPEDVEVIANTTLNVYGRRVG